MAALCIGTRALRVSCTRARWLGTQQTTGGLSVAIDNSYVNVHFATIVNNTAHQQGSALYLTGQAQLAMNSSVLWDAGEKHTVFIDGANCQLDVAYNVIRGLSTLCDGKGAACVTGKGNMELDPLLGDLRENGGPTLTMMPLRNSPLIDRGDAACWAEACAAWIKEGRREWQTAGRISELLKHVSVPFIGRVKLPGFVRRRRGCFDGGFRV